MIEELKVLNGELTPKYDKYNNQYTVKVDNNVSKLDFEFIKDEDTEVTIYGNNNLHEGDNKLILYVKKDNQIEYIYINVIKESTNKVMSIDANYAELDIANSVPIYGGVLIASSCFLIIILLFFLIFNRKKHS